MRIQITAYLQALSALFFHGEPRQRPQRLVVLALIIILTGFAICNNQPSLNPSPSSATSTFSLPDAQAQLAQLASEKHPIGSAANLKARDYLVDQIRAMGYTPQLQSEFVNFEKERASAQVANILVRVIGSKSGNRAGEKAGNNSKALLLVAHYDSAPNSYGASDDGVSVISILQTLRMLKVTARTAPLANDLIVLITDGEEAGLLGAEAFAQSHPWLNDVGMVLNFDNRGNAGPVLMFETSSGNAPLIAGLAQALPNAVTNSVMYEAYKAMPNDTDFTVFRKRGVPGLNFAMIQNLSSYHTPYDKADLLSSASQQQQGEMMWQLVQHFGQQDLSKMRGENHVYFSFPGIGIVHYPASWALPIAALLTLVFVAFMFVARKRAHLSLLKTCGASVSFLLSLAAFAFLSQKAWNLVLDMVPAYRSMRDPDPSHWYLLGIALLCILLFALVQRLLLRWMRGIELAAGAALIWVALLIFTSLQFPGASFLFAWPLLLILLSWLWLSGRKDDHPAHGWILLAGAAFAIVLFAPYVFLFNVALGFHSLGVPLIVFLLLLGVLTPLLLWLLQGLRAVLLLFAAVICFIAAAHATQQFHLTYVMPQPLFYVSGTTPQDAVWLIDKASNGEGNKTALSASEQDAIMLKFYGADGSKTKKRFAAISAANASQSTLPVPEIQVLSDQVNGDKRNVAVLIKASVLAQRSKISIEGVSVLSASIQDKVFNQEPQEKWSTTVFAAPAQGVTLRFTVAATSKPDDIVVRVQDTVPYPSKLVVPSSLYTKKTELIVHVINSLNL
ncbi:MAG: M28 family peptidase [Burkholderiales bacterium]|nr:M28 family peptidase [Burkholderiales bacterium]